MASLAGLLIKLGHQVTGSDQRFYPPMSDVLRNAGITVTEGYKPENLPLKVVIPGFIISELRTAFQMGFLLFVPFILIDLVVGTVLMSLGMMMMPPAIIAMPFTHA